jgi:hypothetical protein
MLSVPIAFFFFFPAFFGEDGLVEIRFSSVELQREHKLD